MIYQIITAEIVTVEETHTEVNNALGSLKIHIHFLHPIVELLILAMI
jgi:hypothetical protein